MRKTEKFARDDHLPRGGGGGGVSKIPKLKSLVWGGGTASHCAVADHVVTGDDGGQGATGLDRCRWRGL